MWGALELAMASTREVIAPPVFASEANTVIPPTPIAGVTYRDPDGAPARSPAGWPYQQIVNSADFNQIMFLISSLLSIMDRKGILGWSQDVNYSEPALVFGSDGFVYKWIQASGPSLGGSRDPASSPSYWSIAPLNGLGSPSEMAAGVATDKAPSIAAVMSIFGKRVFLENDFIRIPDVDGGFIFQFGIANIAITSTGGTATVTLPTAFPNFCRFVCGNYRFPGVVNDCLVVNTSVVSNSQINISLDPSGAGTPPTGTQTAFWIAGGN